MLLAKGFLKDLFIDVKLAHYLLLWSIVFRRLICHLPGKTIYSVGRVRVRKIADIRKTC